MKTENVAGQSEVESNPTAQAEAQDDNDISYEEVPLVGNPVVQLLQPYHVSIEAINKLLVNGYDVESLKIIERQEIEELLCEPYLGDRTKIIHGLNCWRKSQNLPPVSSPLKSLQNLPQTKDRPGNMRRENFTALYLINKSATGKKILKDYNEAAEKARIEKKVCILRKSHRKELVHIIVDEFKDNFGKLTHEELLSRASELNKLFPSEAKHNWYQPTFEIIDGKKIRIGRLARGCLYDRNCNYDSLNAQKQESNDSENITPSRPFSDADWVQYQQTKLWIKHHEDEWPAVMQKWATTSALRLFEVSELKQRSCEIILELFPTLRKPDGYQLARIDFDSKFPTKSAALFAKWSLLVTTLKPIFNTDVTDKSGKAILTVLKGDKQNEGDQLNEDNQLNEGELNEDCRDAVFTLLLPYILPCSVLSLPNKSKWKPSYVESRNSFILWLENITDLQSKVEAHNNSRSKDRGMPLCPLVVVVGPELPKLKFFIVAFGDTFYQLPTFLKALDVCFKLYKIYNLPFAVESAGPWNLLNHIIYEFPLENSCRAKILSISNVINAQS